MCVCVSVSSHFHHVLSEKVYSKFRGKLSKIANAQLEGKMMIYLYSETFLVKYDFTIL